MMFGKRKILIFLTGIWIFLYPCLAAFASTPDGAGGLKELVTEALENNPQVRSVMEAVREAESAVRQARAAEWPVASAKFTYTRPSYVPEVNFGGSYGSVKFGTPNMLNGDLSVSYPFFTWGKVKAGIRQAEIGAENVKIGREQTEREITFAVTQVYFGLALSRQVLATQEENLELIRSQLGMIRQRRENGFASTLDQSRMELELASANSELLRTRGRIRRLEISLNRLTGRPLDSEVRLEPQLPEFPPADKDTIPAGKAVNRDPEMKMLVLNYSTLKLQKTLAKSAWLRPMPAFFFSYSLRNGQLPDVEQLRDTWSAGISVSIALFDGFRAKHIIEGLRAREKRLQADEETKRSELNEKILVARTDLDEALQQITLAERQLAQARESYDTAEKAYREGAVSSLDLLESQRALQKAKLFLLNARFDATVKWCALRKAENLPYINAFEGDES